MGRETDKLIIDKQNVLRSVESETEPHVCIYPCVDKHFSVHYKKQAKRNAVPSEWSRSNECSPLKLLKREVPFLQLDKENLLSSIEPLLCTY